LLGRALSEHFRSIAVSQGFGCRIDRILEEVEEGLETGVPVAFGGRFCGRGKAGQEGKDIIGGYGFDLSVAERFLEPGED
jgi:hypothetical protein